MIAGYRNPNRLFSAAVIGVLLMLVACAPGNVHMKAMVPEQMDVVQQHTGSLMLEVEGGREKHEMNLPQIPNATFLEALRTAIEKSRIFSSVSNTGPADYKLAAFIFNLNQPMFINGDVSLEIAWTLTRADTGAVVWQEAIITTGSGFAAGSSSYNKRVATEQAANKNIVVAIEHLSKIDL